MIAWLNDWLIDVKNSLNTLVVVVILPVIYVDTYKHTREITIMGLT